MRLASRPRPTRLPAHPGPDRTDGNAHARLRPTRAAAEGPPAWSPSNVHAAVSGVHDGRHDRTGPDSACPAVSGRTRSPPSARQPNRKRCGQGNGRTARKAFGHPRSPRPQGGPPGHAEPSPVGPAFAAWQPRSVPRWQHCQRDRYHGSDQAAAWCRSSVQAAPRRTALLGSFRVESRWSGEASSVMTSAQADAGASVGGNAGIVRGWWTDWVGRGVNEQPLVADSQLPWTLGGPCPQLRVIYRGQWPTK
jgi:hypothetical protein